MHDWVCVQIVVQQRRTIRLLYVQTPLTGEDALLATFGVCSGDLIWVRLPAAQQTRNSDADSAARSLSESKMAGLHCYDAQQVAHSETRRLPQAQMVLQLILLQRHALLLCN